MVRVLVSEKQHIKWLRSSMLRHIKRNLGEIKNKLKTSMTSESFDFFASSSSYPLLSVGPSLALEKPFVLKDLYSERYEDVIIKLSSSLIGRKFLNSEKNDEELKFLSMSKKPVPVEVVFSRSPIMRVDFSTITSPVGPRAPIKRLKEQQNPKIPKKVWSLYFEKIKAEEAIEELYSRNYDSYYLTRLLSAGILGKRKTFVPTRWAITAIDSKLSKFNIEMIKDFNEISDFEIYKEEHFSNRFVILLIPGNFEFENFEAWAPSTTWAAKSGFHITEEYENLKGRRTYAYSQAGAYYAVRNAITEFLRRRRRQARVVVFREVSEGYQVPLGVWHVRECVKKALSKQPILFSTLQEAEKEISNILSLDIKEYIKRSRILRQDHITDF